MKGEAMEDDTENREVMIGLLRAQLDGGKRMQANTRKERARRRAWAEELTADIAEREVFLAGLRARLAELEAEVAEIKTGARR